MTNLGTLRLHERTSSRALVAHVGMIGDSANNSMTTCCEGPRAAAGTLNDGSWTLSPHSRYVPAFFLYILSVAGVGPLPPASPPLPANSPVRRASPGEAHEWYGDCET